jgi:hypothetical protein
LAWRALKADEVFALNLIKIVVKDMNNPQDFQGFDPHRGPGSCLAHGNYFFSL